LRPRSSIASQQKMVSGPRAAGPNCAIAMRQTRNGRLQAMFLAGAAGGRLARTEPEGTAAD